jgi:hypothetical protein
LALSSSRRKRKKFGGAAAAVDVEAAEAFHQVGAL